MQEQSVLKTLSKKLIEELGEDPNREGLKDTPKRMANMYKELFKGYDPAQIPNVQVFPNNEDGVIYDEIIVDQGDFYSQCEHHMVPFFGKYYFGYIPGKKIVGLSKVARVVDYFSSRMQIQERLGNDIVNYLDEKLESQGMILILKAEHLCKTMRGAKKKGQMTTSIVRGLFKENPAARNEFLQLIEL